MPILKIRGGFTLSIGDQGAFAAGSIISVDDEFASRIAHMTEPASKAEIEATRPEKINLPKGARGKVLAPVQ